MAVINVFDLLKNLIAELLMTTELGTAPFIDGAEGVSRTSYQKQLVVDYIMLYVILLEVHALKLRPSAASEIQLENDDMRRVAETNGKNQRFAIFFIINEQVAFVRKVERLGAFLGEERSFPFVEPESDFVSSIQNSIQTKLTRARCLLQFLSRKIRERLLLLS